MSAKKPTIPTAIPSSTAAALKNAPESVSIGWCSAYVGWVAIDDLLRVFSPTVEPASTGVVASNPQTHMGVSRKSQQAGDRQRVEHEIGRQAPGAERVIRELRAQEVDAEEDAPEGDRGSHGSGAPTL